MVSSGGGGGGGGEAELPHLELVHRVMGIPLVELALSASASTYLRLKDSSLLVKWALSSAESSLSHAGRQAAPIAGPIAKRLEAPINFVDQKLCRGLDHIEKSVPIVKKPPEYIMEVAFLRAVEAVRPAVERISDANEFVTSQASYIKDMSWKTANQMLDTHLGCAVLKGLDNTASLVEMLIDKYFPPIANEDRPEVAKKWSAATSAEKEAEDKLLHTLQTVGRLSGKAARRVYGHVAHRLRTNGENIGQMLRELVELLSLTRWLQAGQGCPRRGPAPPPRTNGLQPRAGPPPAAQANGGPPPLGGDAAAAD